MMIGILILNFKMIFKENDLLTYSNEKKSFFENVWINFYSEKNRKKSVSYFFKNICLNLYMF